MRTSWSKAGNSEPCGDALDLVRGVYGTKLKADKAHC